MPVALVVAVLLSGCATAGSSLTSVIGRLTLPQGWTRVETRTFDRTYLYDCVDGQAEAFLVYGFERLAVARYEHKTGGPLDAAFWQVATPADAFGLFTRNRSGGSVSVGNEGEGDPGRRLAFWQDRYYVQSRAREALPDADLLALGKAAAAALPSGGARPALVDRLPGDGLDETSVVFFHEELSIQDDQWLGGGNLLSLSPATNGVLGSYAAHGAGKLLVVQYATARAADASLRALQATPSKDLLAARVGQNLLCAVFGTMDVTTANGLLQQALGAR